MSTIQNVEIKKISDTEVEITTEIPAAVFDSYRSRAVRHLAEEVAVDGFRRGHAPESVLLQKVGEGAVLHEMAEEALSSAYPEILREHNIRAIGAPQITITKLAMGNPLGFRAKTAVLPEVVLPDYKKIAKETAGAHDEQILITDEEVEKAIADIRKNWTKKETRDEGQGTRDKRQETRPNDLSRSVGRARDKEKNEKEIELPELTDEFAQKLGNFKTVAELRAKIKENLKEEKTARQNEKMRVALIDGLLARTALPVPEILVAAEKERMMAQFKGQIAEMGAKPEEYFKGLKKTEEEIKKEWTETATKKVRIQLILDEIARKENIVPEESTVTKETERLTKQYPDADPSRARAYMEGILLNEAVFAFLENQKVI